MATVRLEPKKLRQREKSLIRVVRVCCCRTPYSSAHPLAICLDSGGGDGRRKVGESERRSSGDTKGRRGRRGRLAVAAAKFYSSYNQEWALWTGTWTGINKAAGWMAGSVLSPTLARPLDGRAAHGWRPRALPCSRPRRSLGLPGEPRVALAKASIVAAGKVRPGEKGGGGDGTLMAHVLGARTLMAPQAEASAVDLHTFHAT